MRWRLKLPKAESCGLELGTCKGRFPQSGWQLWELTQVFVHLLWQDIDVLNCLGTAGRKQTPAGWYLCVAKEPMLNVGSVLICPSDPGGENKHQQVIVAIAACLRSCMSSHNSFISWMSFEKQSQSLKGCKLKKNLKNPQYRILEIFFCNTGWLVSGRDSQRKILIDWAPFQFYGE